jgi:hypothetical protein
MPSGGTAHLSVARLYSDTIESDGFRFRSSYALLDGTMLSESIEGHEWGTYVALDTFLRRGTWEGLKHESVTVPEFS